MLSPIIWTIKRISLHQGAWREPGRLGIGQGWGLVSDAISAAIVKMLATRLVGTTKAPGLKTLTKTSLSGPTKAKEPTRGKPPDQDRSVEYPIPKGDNPYALAKRFEYIHKDLPMAEKYYRAAIAQRIRVESAVKDLAGVLHQQGRTQEACDLLESHKRLFTDSQAKFENLLQSLRSQTRNASYKYLKLWGLSETTTEDMVKTMYSNPNRIHAVFLILEGACQTALLQFLSLSAARKTVEGFKYPTRYRLESVSLPVEESEEAGAGVFKYSLFAEVNCDNGKEDNRGEEAGEEEGAVYWLGRELYRSICLETALD